MKNFPLLSLNRNKQWINWRKTYLTELNKSICALWNFSNYFLPEYYEYAKSDIFYNNTNNKIEITKLPYNAFFRAEVETHLVINGSEQSKPILGAGYILISKAKNEGSLNFKTSLDNYFIQPFGYGSYYIFTYSDTGLIAVYDKYAEENYGLNYQFSLFSTHPRFIYNQIEQKNGREWTLTSYFTNNQDRNIITKDGTVWTDRYHPPMVFWYNDNEEEIIVDSKEYTTIRVDRINICEYNTLILEKEDDGHIWPTDIIPRTI